MVYVISIVVLIVFILIAPYVIRAVINLLDEEI